MLNLTFGRGEKAEEESKNGDTETTWKNYVGVRFVHNTVFQLSKILCFFSLQKKSEVTLYLGHCEYGPSKMLSTAFKG